MKIAQVGYGYWGRNTARTLHQLADVELTGLFDLSAERLAEARQNLPGVQGFLSYEEILGSNIDAVVIATPPDTHYQLASAALDAGKHVFVEKPVATRLKDAYDLIGQAERKNLVLFADHVFLYAEPVRYLKRMIDSGELGDIVYIHARRVNLGLFQHKVDVIWDLAVHDISIIDYLLGFDIARINVFKKYYQDFPNCAIANINADLASGASVNINVSWLSPVKVREMVIGGTRKMAVYDDTAENKIQVYDHGVLIQENLETTELHQQLVQYRIGDVHAPELPKRQSLDNAMADFVDCVRTGRQPVSGRDSIINTMEALEIVSRV